jgi:hypothetical protein
MIYLILYNYNYSYDCYFFSESGFIKIYYDKQQILDFILHEVDTYNIYHIKTDERLIKIKPLLKLNINYTLYTTSLSHNEFRLPYNIIALNDKYFNTIMLNNDFILNYKIKLTNADDFSEVVFDKNVELKRSRSNNPTKNNTLNLLSGLSDIEIFNNSIIALIKQNNELQPILNNFVDKTYKLNDSYFFGTIDYKNMTIFTKVYKNADLTFEQVFANYFLYLWFEIIIKHPMLIFYYDDKRDTITQFSKNIFPIRVDDIYNSPYNVDPFSAEFIPINIILFYFNLQINGKPNLIKYSGDYYIFDLLSQNFLDSLFYNDTRIINILDSEKIIIDKLWKQDLLNIANNVYNRFKEILPEKLLIVVEKVNIDIIDAINKQCKKLIDGDLWKNKWKK